MLNTDVIYHIFNFSDIDTILSFCLTSRYQFNDKLFWLNKFKLLPMASKWVRYIYKYSSPYLFISYYKLFTQLDSYYNYTNTFKVLKNKTGNIYFDLHKTDKLGLQYILDKVFDINHIKVYHISSMHFWYNGYVWIVFYNYKSQTFNLDHVKDIEKKMILFLYKLLKYKLTFKYVIN